MLISRTDVIALNSRSSNLLAGETYEFIPAAAIVSVRLAASATGLRFDLGIGGELQVVNGIPPATNRFPLAPDDTITSFSAAQGERLSLFATNTTAGNLTLNTVVEIIPQ